MAAPLPVTGVKPRVDFRDPTTITPLIRQGGLCQLEEPQLDQLVTTVGNLVSRFQGHTATPVGTEKFLDAILEKARLARGKKELYTEAALHRDELILSGDRLWQALSAYAATKRARDKFSDI